MPHPTTAAATATSATTATTTTTITAATTVRAMHSWTKHAFTSLTTSRSAEAFWHWLASWGSLIGW